MAQRTYHEEFRDQNNRSRYPFYDSATLLSRTGQTIPENMLIDASVYPLGMQTGAWLTGIKVEEDLIEIRIGDQENTERCTARFRLNEVEESVTLYDTTGIVVGMLVTAPERMAALGTWANGLHPFDQNASELVPSCVIPMPASGLQGLAVDGDTVATGDVWIVGENGVVVREEEGTIRIDVVGDPLFRRKLCEEAGLFRTPRFLKTINGIESDANGDFKIEVCPHPDFHDTVLRINKKPGEISFSVEGAKVQR